MFVYILIAFGAMLVGMDIIEERRSYRNGRNYKNRGNGISGDSSGRKRARTKKSDRRGRVDNDGNILDGKPQDRSSGSGNDSSGKPSTDASVHSEADRLKSEEARQNAKRLKIEKSRQLVKRILAKRKEKR